MSALLNEGFRVAVEIMRQVPPTYVRNGLAVLFACWLLSWIVGFVRTPAALRAYPILRSDPEVRVDLERRLYEIRADEEVAYQRWRERRRSVRRRSGDLLALAREASEARQSVDSGDTEIDAEIVAGIDAMVLDLVRSSGERDAGKRASVA